MRKLIFIALLLAGGSVAFANSGALFTGGTRSGAAQASFFTAPQVAEKFHFLGGHFSGATDAILYSPWWQHPPQRFLGGSFDGYDYNALFGMPNWTLFQISQLLTGPKQKIFVYCVPGSFYTLQRSTNLTSGWVSVPNQIRVSPASQGVWEMDDAYSGSRAFYRVLLEH